MKEMVVGNGYKYILISWLFLMVSTVPMRILLTPEELFCGTNPVNSTVGSLVG